MTKEINFEQIHKNVYKNLFKPDAKHDKLAELLANMATRAATLAVKEYHLQMKQQDAGKDHQDVD